MKLNNWGEGGYWTGGVLPRAFSSRRIFALAVCTWYPLLESLLYNINLILRNDPLMLCSICSGIDLSLLQLGSKVESLESEPCGKNEHSEHLKGQM